MEGTRSRPVAAMRRSAPSVARSATPSEAGDYYVDARSTPVDGYDPHLTIQHLQAELAAEKQRAKEIILTCAWPTRGASIGPQRQP